MTKKEKFASKMTGVATQFINLRQEIKDLGEAYIDRGYNAEGGNPIIDEDVVSLEVTAAQIGAWTYWAALLDLFMSGQATSVHDGDATLNAIRNDF
jgi:hypothetical protein